VHHGRNDSVSMFCIGYRRVRSALLHRQSCNDQLPMAALHDFRTTKRRGGAAIR